MNTPDNWIMLAFKKTMRMDRMLKMMLHSTRMALPKRQWTFWAMLEARMMSLMKTTVDKLMVVDFF